MATLLTPPDRPTQLPSRDEGQLALWSSNDPAGLDLTPHLLIQLEDDLERARMREAFWISVAVHLMVVILLVFSPKIFPGMKGMVLATPADLMKDQQMTYLDLPPDQQKEPKVTPKTNVLSDKNRIAESRKPTLDKHTLQELKRAGAPKAPAAPSQQAKMTAPVQPQAPQQAQPQQNQNQQQMAQLQPGIPQDNPKLPSPQQNTPNFAKLMSTPGAAMQQAVRGAAAGRMGQGASFGGGGDYGAGPGASNARVQGNLEVLSDTQGVDFGPYLSRVLDAVRRNWYNLIPEEARAPLMKKGKVAIEFAILKNGQVAGMKITGPSGDVSLDRAAWGGITASVPFQPLPNEYHGQYLALRFHFYYNPAKGDIE